MVSRDLVWCLVHKKKVKAAAPTGIAAANVEIEGTDVAATTLHALLQLDGELHTKLNFGKLDDPKVALLMQLEVLLLDEVSMLDENAWTVITQLLSIIDHNRRPDGKTDGDPFGHIHIILFGDFKQDPVFF